MRRSKSFFLIINNGTTYSSNMGYNPGNIILGEKNGQEFFLFPSRMLISKRVSWIRKKKISRSII